MAQERTEQAVFVSYGQDPNDLLVKHWITAHVPTGQINHITVLATTVLEDAGKAVKWLSDPNPATDDRAPIELIGEPQGYERVKNLLLRIEHGVLA